MNKQQLIDKRNKLNKQIEELENKEKLDLEKNKDKPIWTKIPELKIEISNQIYNDKTYPEILQLVKEEQIVTSDMLFKLRKLTDKYPQFKDFWVFVPNPDEISKNNNYVARFVASSFRAGLYCYWSPDYRYSGLGVFLFKKLNQEDKR